MIASREIITNVWFYIGIKRGETVGSDFKFVSSGITVPYMSDIVGLENDNSDQCVFVKNSATLYWDDAPCNLSWYSICEPASMISTGVTSSTTTGRSYYVYNLISV